MHSDFTRPPIRVDLVGVDARARERFETMFRDLDHGAYMVVNSTVAEIAIVDLDNPDGNVAWHRYCQQFPDRPLILLSDSTPPFGGGERFLRKPIRVDALLEVLEETRRQLEILDENVNSRAKRKPADEVEPGTIKITEQNALVPPECAVWRDESSLAFADPSSESKPDSGPNMSCCQAFGDVVNTAPDGPANGSNMSPEHSPQVPAPPPTTLPVLPDAVVEFDGTSEKTYRYPQSQRPDVHTVNPSPQQQPYPEPKSVPSVGTLAQPIDGPALGERQQQVIFLSVHDRLLGLLESALKESALTQRAVELALDNGHLVVHAAQSRIRSGFIDQQLRQLSKRTILSTQVRISPCGADSRDPSPTSGTLLSAWETVEAFLWKLALWTYGGCLPLGTRLEQRVYLRHWPNLTRLYPVPDAMRIASLWNEQPMTLGYTAKALGIPQQHVFNFYGASHAIGLAGQARRESDYLFHEASTHTKGKLGFVSDMMKRLRSIGNG